MTKAKRTPSAIDQLAEEFVDEFVARSPELATSIGRDDEQGRLDDYSLAGIESDRAFYQSIVDRLAPLEPADEVDAATKADILRSAELALEIHDADWHLRNINVIASPVQGIREIFDMMPTATAADWEVVARRLGNVPEALQGYEETLRVGIEQGVVPAKRQVRESVKQIAQFTADGGFFDKFVAEAAPDEGELSDEIKASLRASGDAARAAYDALANFLTNELEPVSSEQDAVGRELYELFSRQFVGAAIDLDETYEWGLQELARMVAEQESIAKEILPGASVQEAIAYLEQDSERKLKGTDNLKKWMQETSDRAVRELGETHFDIPEEIRTLECMIAPSNSGIIYYTGPTDDFSRPGRMWWSVPEGVDEFDTWRELTTVYHEGVPGHHLQVGLATYNRDELNSWRRLLSWNSGHGEGWALYSERLMEELGYLDDPADRLGMLDGQRMRAARVVLDIGVHLGKQRPDGEGVWDAEYALEFMRQHVNMSDEFIQFEVNRYLGWPGQAPSYKVGQRIWEQIRDEVAAQQGDDFDIKDFHMKALRLGGVGLDTLRTALTGV